jgi:hypothetical protein
VWRVLFNDTVSWKDYIASAKDQWMSAQQWWNETDRIDEVLDDELVPVTFVHHISNMDSSHSKQLLCIIWAHPQHQALASRFANSWPKLNHGTDPLRSWRLFILTLSTYAATDPLLQQHSSPHRLATGSLQAQVPCPLLQSSVATHRQI